MPFTDFQRDVAAAALKVAAAHGFVLGGGNALILHGIIDRYTADVDLVTDQPAGVEAAAIRGLSRGHRRGRGGTSTVGRLSGGAPAPPAMAGSSRAGMVLPERVREQHSPARARPGAVPGLVIARFCHGDRPPRPQPQEPTQLWPASRVTCVVYRPPVFRQERFPLAIGQRAQDALRVERVLLLRRADR